jgi:hypothetical protein
VGHFGTLEFGRYREIEAIGYDKAVREVGKWMSGLRANTDNRLRQWATRRRNPRASMAGKNVAFGGGDGGGLFQSAGSRLESGVRRPSAPMDGGFRSPLSNSDRKKTAPPSMWKTMEGVDE